MTTNSRDELMTPAEVAARSGLSVKTVRRAIRSGALVAYQPTARYLIPEWAFEAWITRPAAAAKAAGDGRRPPACPPETGSVAELLMIEAGAA